MPTNPSNLYGGYDVKLDTTSAVNYYLKRQAQEQAQATALDKYYTNLTQKATDRGVRDQDITAFQEAIQDYKDFYMKNKRAILNGDLAATRQADIMSRIPFTIAAKSREAYAMDNRISTARIANPDISKRWTKKTFDAISAHSQPVYTKDQNGQWMQNPNYRPIDPIQFETLPKEINLSERYADAGLKSGAKPGTINVKTYAHPDTKNNPFTNIEETEEGFDVPNLRKIAEYARNNFDDAAEYTLKLKNKDKTIDQIKQDDVDEYNRLNTAYKKVYGDNANIATDQDYYVASAIVQNDAPVIKKTEKRNDIAWAEWNRKRDLENSILLAKKKNEMKASSPGIDVDNISTSFESIPDGDYGTAIKKGNIWYDKKTNQPYNSAGDAFDIIITKDKMPPDMLVHVSPSYRPGVEKVKLKIVNGVTQGASGDSDSKDIYGLLTREDLVKKELKTSGKKVPLRSIGGKSTPAAPKSGSLNDL